MRMVIRLAKLVDLGQRRRHVQLQELSQELGVHTRTLRRDLEAMELANVPTPIWRFNPEA